MSLPPHKLTDAEGALLDEISLLAHNSQPAVAIKDLELRLGDRGYSEMQVRRALASLLRRGQIALSGANRVAWRASDGHH